MRRARRRAAGPAVAGLAVAVLSLGGCVVGPTYKGPPPVAPEAVSAGRFHRAEDALAAPPPARWWAALRDRELDRLVQAAFDASPDLEAARARLRQSRAGLRQARAERLPSTQASGVYLRTRGATSFLGDGAAAVGSVGPTQAGGGEATAFDQGGEFSLYDVGFDATWEVDLFGGQARAVESAKARAQAVEANLQDAQVSLAADVAQAYVSLRDLQARVGLARQDAEIESRLLELTRMRRAGGTASDLDVERLNDQLQSTRAELVPIQAQVTDQLDRLAVLTGRAPGALDEALSAAAPVPTPPAVVAVGDPAGLLRRRPDIRAAERQIQQQNAVIGERVADLFPKVELLGNVGFGSTDLSDLLEGGSFSYAVAPILQWRPFDFGRTRARIVQAQAARDEALANYRKTVLQALQDAEASLARYGRQRESVVSLMRVRASADRAAGLTRLRVQGGTATTLDVLDAERRRVQAESRVAQANAQLTLDYVAIQKSLGLGWRLPESNRKVEASAGK